MYELLKNNNLDFVFGSRYIDNRKSDDDTIITQFGNFFFTKLISVLFNFETTDALFLFLFGKKDCFEKLELKEKDFKICIEALVKARLEFKCEEIFSHEAKRIHGETKVNRLFDGLKILYSIINLYLKVKFKKL